MPQDAAFLLIFDLAANADAAEGRHQYQIASGNADVGRERGPLGTDALFDDLHQHFVAAAKDLLNGWLESRTATPQLTSLGAIAIVFTIIDVRTRDISIHDLFWVIAGLSKVLGLDVTDVQEAVAADTKVDEGCLDAGFQIDNFSFVDIACIVVLTGPLGVQFFEHTVFENRNPTFLRLRNVDQHFFSHMSIPVNGFWLWIFRIHMCCVLKNSCCVCQRSCAGSHGSPLRARW